jgi:hypothetical protein
VTGIDVGQIVVGVVTGVILRVIVKVIMKRPLIYALGVDVALFIVILTVQF